VEYLSHLFDAITSIRWNYPLSSRRLSLLPPLSTRPIHHCACQYGLVYHKMGSLMLKNIGNTPPLSYLERVVTWHQFLRELFLVSVSCTTPLLSMRALPSAKKSHSRRCVLARKDTKDGPLCIITPQESSWYCVYNDNYLLRKANSFMAKKFCNRFCFPYSSFLDLLNQVKSNKRFDRWCCSKSNEKKLSPIKLLLLRML
jgi:hypothetical protein